MRAIIGCLNKSIVLAALIVVAPWALASNLTVDGDLTVNDDTTLKGDATIEGDVTLEGDLDARAGGSHAHLGSLRIGIPEENGHDGMVNLVRQPVATSPGDWHKHRMPGRPLVEVVTATRANAPPSGLAFKTQKETVEYLNIYGDFGGATLVVSGYVSPGGIAGGGTNISKIKVGVVSWTETGGGRGNYVNVTSLSESSYTYIDRQEITLLPGVVRMWTTVSVEFVPGTSEADKNEYVYFADLFIGDTRTIGQAGTYSLVTDEYDGRKLKLEYTTPSRQVRNDFVMSTIGHLGLGTNDPTERLTVNGKIKTKEVIVTALGWPDFVFEEDYPQPSLAEWEQHIEDKGHLPGIPSKAEVDLSGVGLGEMQRLLLQKIEELTLIILEQNETLTEQREKLVEQDRRLGEQEKRIMRQEETIGHLLVANEANEAFRAEIESMR